MSKSVLFSCFVAISLLFSSCNNAGEQSSDLELVSKNLDVAFEHNRSGSMEISSQIKEFFVNYSEELEPRGKEKYQNILNKIAELDKEEKKALDVSDSQISNNDKNSPLELEKLKSSAEDFLKAINSNIEINSETEMILNDIKSLLDFSSYKLSGNKIENSLALKSMKLSISAAHFESVRLLRSMVTLKDPKEAARMRGEIIND